MPYRTSAETFLAKSSGDDTTLTEPTSTCFRYLHKKCAVQAGTIACRVPDALHMQIQRCDLSKRTCMQRLTSVERTHSLLPRAISCFLACRLQISSPSPAFPTSITSPLGFMLDRTTSGDCVGRSPELFPACPLCTIRLSTPDEVCGGADSIT